MLIVALTSPDIDWVSGKLEIEMVGFPEIPTVISGKEETPIVVIWFDIETAPEIGCAEPLKLIFWIDGKLPTEIDGIADIEIALLTYVESDDADIPWVWGKLEIVTLGIEDTPTTVAGFDIITEGVPEIPTIVCGLLIVTFGIDEIPTV